MPERFFRLTDEEMDRLIEKLDLLRGDEDVEYLKKKLLRQQLHNPADQDQI